MSENENNFLCRLDELDETGAVGVHPEGDTHGFVIVRHDEGPRAYVNRCPHLGTPLEVFPNRFLDEAGRELVCATHGARFNIADGLCISGPCVGMSLTPRKIHRQDDLIFLVKDE